MFTHGNDELYGAIDINLGYKTYRILVWPEPVAEPGFDLRGGKIYN